MALSIPPVSAGSAHSGPVNIVYNKLESGVTAAQVGFDYTKAPVPSLAYFADYCDVKRLRNAMVLVFGKLNGTGTVLRTQVEIAFPQSMFEKQLWKGAAPLRQTLQKLFGSSPDESRPELSDSEKIQTFAANNVFLASSADEGSMDFYYLSPRGVFLAQAATDVEIDFQPVIRISSDAALMREFLDRCEPYVKERKDDAMEREQFAV